MPWKLIGLVLLLVLVAAFATLNLSNRTDISLGVHVFRQVPIFLSLLVAFLAGILVTVPFTVGRSRRRRAASPRRYGRAQGPGAHVGGAQGPGAQGRDRDEEGMGSPTAPAAAPVVEEPATETRPRSPARGKGSPAQGKAKSSGSGKSKRG